MVARGLARMFAVSLAASALVCVSARGESCDGRVDHKGCNRGSYSIAHYWFPGLWRLHARHKFAGIAESYASAHYCEIPINYAVLPSPCPYAPPGTLNDYRTLSAPAGPSPTAAPAESTPAVPEQLPAPKPSDRP